MGKVVMYLAIGGLQGAETRKLVPAHYDCKTATQLQQDNDIITQHQVQWCRTPAKRKFFMRQNLYISGICFGRVKAV